jgi:hypothetical protein
MNKKLVIAFAVIAVLASAFVILSKHAPVQYRNTQYGFSVTLPDSWKGFAVIAGTREIRDIASGAVVATAPTVKLRNPLWTAAKPYEDLPIDIYTTAQWTKIIGEQYSVGAAPIPPSELAHNAKYVFALPARYNYDFALGYEALDQLIHSGIVTAF